MYCYLSVSQKYDTKCEYNVNHWLNSEKTERNDKQTTQDLWRMDESNKCCYSDITQSTVSPVLNPDIDSRYSLFLTFCNAREIQSNPVLKFKLFNFSLIINPRINLTFELEINEFYEFVIGQCFPRWKFISMWFPGQ